MKLTRKRGDTSNIFQVFIQDSSSTTGAGLTGLAFNTSGLTAYYHKDTDTTATAITLATMTVGTFTSSGFKEIDATNMPGWYQFCPPDAALSTSGTPHSVGFHLKGATNMAPLPIEVQLIAADLEDTVRLGLTALPNVASGSAGAIPTTGTGSNQISVSSGQVILQSGTGTGQLDFTSGVVKANATQLLGTAWLTPGTAGTPDVNAKLLGGTAQTGRDVGASVLLSTGTGTGQLDFTSGVVKANVTQWLGGTIPAVSVTGVPLVDLKYTLGTISPATAGSVRADAVTGAVGSVTGLTASDVGTIKTQTDKLTFTVANVVDANMLRTNGDATSAANVAKTTRAIVRCTVGSASTTTSIVTSACTPAGAVADQFKGRIITFDADTTTTALRGQSTDITASSNAATPTFTATALTTAPVSGDTFSVT